MHSKTVALVPRSKVVTRFSVNLISLVFPSAEITSTPDTWSTSQIHSLHILATRVVFMLKQGGLPRCDDPPRGRRHQQGGIQRALREQQPPKGLRQLRRVARDEDSRQR